MQIIPSGGGQSVPQPSKSVLTDGTGVTLANPVGSGSAGMLGIPIVRPRDIAGGRHTIFCWQEVRNASDPPTSFTPVATNTTQGGANTASHGITCWMTAARTIRLVRLAGYMMLQSQQPASSFIGAQCQAWAGILRQTAPTFVADGLARPQNSNFHLTTAGSVVPQAPPAGDWSAGTPTFQGASLPTLPANIKDYFGAITPAQMTQGTSIVIGGYDDPLTHLMGTLRAVGTVPAQQHGGPASPHVDRELDHVIVSGDSVYFHTEGYLGDFNNANVVDRDLFMAWFLDYY